MPWSKSDTEKDFKSMVLKKDRALESAIDFVPHAIELKTSKEALAYLTRKKAGSEFRMSDASRTQTGVDEIEKATEEKRLEALVLEKLKEIEEPAYKAAYELGLDEGRAEALRKASAELEDKLEQVSVMLQSLENLKSELVAQNETHLVQLLLHLSSKIAMDHLETNRESIINVIKSAVQLAQDEERILLRLNPEQIEFIESLKKHSNREFDFLKKLTLEADPQVSVGGCIIETNYGQVDARTEERIGKLWETVSESLKRVVNKIGA